MGEPISEWKSLYEQGLSTYKIADKYNVKQDIVRRRLIKAGIQLRNGNTRHNPDWKQLIEKYNKDLCSVAQLSREIGCDPCVIHKGFRERGVTVRGMNEQCEIDRRLGRRYFCSVKENFFDSWSSEMAYVLGWIASDGSIHKNLNSFTITSSDLEHLDKLADLLGSNSKICLYRGKRNIKTAGKLTISRQCMVQKLLELGMTPNKTKTLQFPLNIPREYLGDYVRGYFEGDGYVGVATEDRKTPKITVSFSSSSLGFIKSLRRNIEREITAKGFVHHNHQTGVNVLFYVGVLNVFNLYQFMYNDVPHLMCLDRKLNIFTDYFQLKEVREYCQAI